MGDGAPGPTTDVPRRAPQQLTVLPHVRVLVSGLTGVLAGAVVVPSLPRARVGVVVLGDDRERSRGSRGHRPGVRPGEPASAAVSGAQHLVVGRAIVVSGPVGHARWLRIPATVDAVPAAAAAPAQPAIDAGPEASC